MLQRGSAFHNPRFGAAAACTSGAGELATKEKHRRTVTVTGQVYGKAMAVERNGVCMVPAWQRTGSADNSGGTRALNNYNFDR